jgi:hypothetical protein
MVKRFRSMAVYPPCPRLSSENSGAVPFGHRRDTPSGSPMAGLACRFTNPQGWQRVAGGRNAVETSGSGVSSFGILEGCQSSATPAGANGDFGMRTGGALRKI